MTVVLLGPQRFEPTLRAAVEAVGVEGNIALITAGWQEREPEDGELSEHLGGRTQNLMLHRRAEEVFRDDAALAEGHHERQLKLRRMQDFYRIRLEALLESARVIAERVAPEALLAEEAQWSIQGLRVLDRYHLERCQRVQLAFDEQWRPLTRAAVARQREAIAATLRDCDALAVAGGHVATIINRMRLFGIADMLGDKPLFAWSAGAMAVTQSVVLFHDFEPYGTNAPQLLDGGLGMVGNVVALPSPQERLRLDDAGRMATYAMRFAPRHCLALPRRSWVIWQDGELSQPHGVLRLMEDGAVRLLEDMPPLDPPSQAGERRGRGPQQVRP